MATRAKAYVDTSALIAFADRSDSYHALFRRLFSDPPPLLTTTLVTRLLASAPYQFQWKDPIAAVAPVISNAIFDATGIRRRSLPLVPNGLEA